jgi:hypothetical protein
VVRSDSLSASLLRSLQPSVAVPKGSAWYSACTEELATALNCAAKRQAQVVLHRQHMQFKIAVL